MSQTTRPTEGYLGWTVATGTKTAPTSGQLSTGWTYLEPPPMEYMNYIQNLFDRWIQYLDYMTTVSNRTSVSALSPVNMGAPVDTYLLSNAAGTATFPAAVSNQGYRATIANIGSGNITIGVQTGDKLQGTTNGTYVLGPNESMTFCSDGSAGFWKTGN